MGKLFHKIKQLYKRSTLNFHRCVMSVERNAVLIIVDIRGVLESPYAAAHCNADNSVVIPRRMIQVPRISLIFHAQQALGITALLCKLCRCNRLRILLRL